MILYKQDKKYFEVYRGDIAGIADSAETITVNTGLIIFCEPRITTGRGVYETVTSDVENPDIFYVDRLRQSIINPETVTVTKTGKLFLKLNTGGYIGTPATGPGNLLDVGTGVGDQEHPDYHFGSADLDPEYQVGLLSKNYAPEVQLEANYIFQEEYPEDVTEENEELSRNIDSVELDGSIITVTSFTYILIAEITVTDEVRVVHQRHWGPLVWHSPIIRYGDFDYRQHA